MPNSSYGADSRSNDLPASRPSKEPAFSPAAYVSNWRDETGLAPFPTGFGVIGRAPAP